MSRVHLPGLAVMALAALAAVAALPSKTLSEMREHSELNALGELGELGVQLDVQDKQDTPINREVAVQSSTPIIIARYGYPAETHTVKTADGYLLSIHRIPNPGKPVIFLQHGILSSSADWVVLGPKKSLGFLLYNAGYDVWMGNFRGNSYSRAHMKLTTKDNAFWDFSWHEMGIYDIPAVIDYILASTGQKSLVYVGHSQGTTAFLVMSSLLPEYSQKVKAFIAMAPVAFMGKIGSLPLKIIAKATKEIGLIAKLLGIGEFLPSSSFLSSITTQLCAGSSSILQGLCTNILFLFTGFDSVELDTEMLPEILQNVPAGASTKQLVHYGQLIESDKFRQYDYGAWNNLLKYGSISPPKYPLEKITTRVYLHYADNDLLAVPQGVQRLSKGLINVKVLRKVPFEKYNHVDFLYARNSKTLIYQNVMDNIQEVLQEAD